MDLWMENMLKRSPKKVFEEKNYENNFPYIVLGGKPCENPRKLKFFKNMWLGCFFSEQISFI